MAAGVRGRAGDRRHEHRADPGGEVRAEAEGAVDRAGDGRGDAADQRRRVGVDAVRSPLTYLRCASALISRSPTSAGPGILRTTARWWARPCRPSHNATASP